METQLHAAFVGEHSFGSAADRAALRLRRQSRAFWQAPPTDAVYFHRKLGGMFLLASRLKARVNVHQLITRFI